MRDNGTPQVKSLQDYEIEDIYPLSDIEKGMVFHSLKDPAVYYSQMVFELRIPRFDPALLEKAFALMVEKHPKLRTGFNIYEYDEPVQVVFKEISLNIRHYDLSKKKKSRQEGLIKGIMEEDRGHFFNVETPEPLWRVRTFDLGNSNVFILWIAHHAMVDGWSFASLLTELSNTYFNLESDPGFVPEKLKNTYKEFVVREIIEKRKKENIEFWKRELAGYKRLKFPGKPRHDHKEEMSGRTRQRIELSWLRDPLMSAAKTYNTSLKNLCFAAYIFMLNMLSYDNDILVGLVTNNRPLCEDGNKIIGCFLNTVPVRMRIPANSKWRDFARFVDNKLRELKKYERMPLFEIIRLTEEKTRDENPLFDAVFNFVDFHIYDHLDQEKFPGNPWGSDKNVLAIDGGGTTNTLYDFTLHASFGGLYVSLSYHRAIASDNLGNRLSEYFKETLKKLAFEPEGPASKHQLLSKEEKQDLLYRFNDTGVEYPKEKTIPGLFTEQVEKTPDHVALLGIRKTQEANYYMSHKSYTSHISYKVLNEKSNRLAHFLREKGVKPDTIVALMMGRSVDMAAAVLAVLKAGGAYLPIDPEGPGRRTAEMLDDSQTPMLLTQTNILKKYPFTLLQGLQAGEIKPLVTPARQPMTKLDQLPFPDRSLVNYEKYNRYIGHTLVQDCISIQATRGCPFNCAYCHKLWPKTHIVRSAENVFAEVQFNYNLGVRRFSFVDDIFNFNVKNSRRFFELIIENDLEVQLLFMMRGDILTPDYIDLMVKAGTIRIALALETASPRLQKLIGKNLNIEKLRKNIEYIAQQYPQVILELYTMHGFPTETREEALMTLDFIKSIQWLDFPYVFILKVYPNTDMEKLAIESGISRDAIERSLNRAYHELPDTLPFEKSFTSQYQADFLNNYFLSPERLLKKLPFQMQVLTEEELVQKYNSYLPMDIGSMEDLLQFTGIRRDSLSVQYCMDKARVFVPRLNEKNIEAFAPLSPQPDRDAFKILLLDLSQDFSQESNLLNDLVEPPLGLMCLLTFLEQQWGNKINGKIAKSLIDFNSLEELKQLLEEFKPHLIGIRTLSYFMDFFHRVTARIRQWGFQAPIITGGPYATSGYRTLLRDKNIDLVVLGEGEITFNEVVGKIIRNNGKLPDQEELAKIPGLAFIPGKVSPGKFAREIMPMDDLDELLGQQSRENPLPVNQPGDLAYVIYTSGSTGKPKGTMLEHRQVNYLAAGLQERVYNTYAPPGKYLKVALLSPYIFDASVKQIFLALLQGHCLQVVPEKTRIDGIGLVEFYRREGIDISDGTPTHIRILRESTSEDCFDASIKCFLIGGEPLPRETASGFLSCFTKNTPGIINVYGPTECCVDTTTYEVTKENTGWFERIPIGKPMPNARVYILDRENQLQPAGVAGELYIGGHGVARGYLNNPDLTIEKFPRLSTLFYRSYRSYMSYISNKSYIYRTGDLACWLSDGNIQFLGRTDHQVKIRGFRIELEEIERCLLKYHSILEAVVLLKTDKTGDKYLCAYYVPRESAVFGEETLTPGELRNYLAEELPGHMIPSRFVAIEEIPLTPNGKIDRNALPDPEVGGDNYSAPRDQYQCRLVEIWSEVLGIEKDKISIDDNFFEIGGHSLKATLLIGRMHKAFDIKITLDILFKKPTIRAIASVLSRSEKTKFMELEKVEKKEYYPLSFNQKRLWLLRRLEPLSPAYHMPGSLLLEYNVQEEHIRQTLTRLMERHESFRTGFKEVKDEPVQFVKKSVDVPFRFMDISRLAEDKKKQERALIYKKVVETLFDLSCPPIFHSVLVKLDENHYEFMYNRHHIITDGWSDIVLANEFSQIYQGFREGKAVPSPPLYLQYKDYAEWYHKWLTIGASGEESRVYWRKKLEKGFPDLQLPLDYAGSRNHRAGAGWRCRVRQKLKDKIKKIADTHHTTLFMVAFSAYLLVLNRFANQEDIVCSIIADSRDHPSLQEVMGFFVNAIPLAIHVNPGVGERFNDFLVRVQGDVSEAFQHQNYPLELAADEMKMKYPELSVSFNMANMQDITPMENLESFQPYHMDNIQDVKFDMETYFTEYRDGISLFWSYKRKIFKPGTIEYIGRQYLKLLEEIAEAPDRPITEFTHFVLEPGKIKGNRIKPVNEFCQFKKEALDESVVHRFETQVREYPDRIALKAGMESLSYAMLNRQANVLAHAILENYHDEYQLTPGEKTRYNRQMLLHNWGVESQEKLKSSTVFAAGAGGSGSPLLMQLALAGIGTIIVCDYDTVDLSNLNRQVLHDHTRIGMNKALSAKITINRINPHVKVIAYPEKITRDNVLRMVGEADIIFDNVDDMEAKFLLSQCAVEKQIPHIISSMIDLNAYTAIFHTPYTPCFHCLYNRDILKEMTELETVVENYRKNPNPVASPSLFLSTGFAVNEAIKILLGFENPAYNKYFLFNQKGSKEIVNTDGYRQITYPFSDHFKRICQSQGFDWEQGWRGNFLEELTIEPDPFCPLCSPHKKEELRLPKTSQYSPVPVAMERVPAAGDADIESKSLKTAALLFGHNTRMIVSIIGTLKAGKTYVPLDPAYPTERLTHMLEDSGARVIVTSSEYFSLALKLRDQVNKNITVIDMNLLDHHIPYPDPGINIQPQDAAYVLYTSGSTGKPKGVVQSHRNVLHFARVYTNNLHLHPGDRLSLFSSYSFDAAKMDIYGALLNGAALYPYDIKEGDNLARLPQWLEKEGITIYHSIPTVYRYFTGMLTPGPGFKSLRFIVLGGEAVFQKDVENYKRYFHDHCLFINGLGPTESTVTLQYFIDKHMEITREAVPVGYPVQETHVYLLDENDKEVCVYGTGEIVYKSDYLALAYLNDREQTGKVLVTDPVTGNGRVFRSGDLGRRLPDGSIEYVGRKDFQVKVSGYRIELSEIEARLDRMKGIKKSVVVCRRNQDNENYLAAYYSKAAEKDLDENHLVEGLKHALPDYMIPGVFFCLEEFPMTPTGKIDRKSLANLDHSGLLSNFQSVSPRDEIEKHLTAIWENVLDTDTPLGIDDNFFVLGGNSLKAIILISRVHKAFNVKIPLPEIFKTPTVRQLAQYIKHSRREIHQDIRPVEKKEYYPQSSAQKRLFFLNRLENIGTTYNIPAVLKLNETLDKDRCKYAVRALIQRQEALRTSFELINNEPVQVIHDEVEFSIEYLEGTRGLAPLPGESAADIISSFFQPFDLSRAPLLRVGIITLPDREHLFIYDIHHIISDGTSMGILADEFMRIYRDETLTPLKVQYKDFSVWQENLVQTGVARAREEYWLKLYSGEIPRLNLPLDHPRREQIDFKGDKFGFFLEADETRRLKELCSQYGTTLYMKLLTVFYVLLHIYSGQDDIIVGAAAAGRPHADLQNIIGMFVNVLALRNYPHEDKSYREFLEEVKENCIDAFENQEVQFEELINKLNIKRESNRNPLFDVLFVVQNFETPDADQYLPGMEFAPYEFEIKTSNFEIVLYAEDRGDKIYLTLRFEAALFERSTIEKFSRRYIEIIKKTIADVNIKVKDISIGHDLSDASSNIYKEDPGTFQF